MHRPVRVLLGVSGSVATIKLEELVKKLQQIPTEVKIVSTDSARHFFKEEWTLDLPILGTSFPSDSCIPRKIGWDALK